MKRTVYLPEREAAALRRLAAATGRSQAEIIREAISVATADAAPPRRFRSAAAGRGGGESVARNADEIVRRELGSSPR